MEHREYIVTEPIIGEAGKVEPLDPEERASFVDAVQEAIMSDLEDKLLDKMREAGLPDPEREWRFYPPRKWAADFGWPFAGISGVMVEVEGGTWMRTRTGRSGGHAHPKRFEEDCEKYNEAAVMGITVIRVTPKMINDGRAIHYITRALRRMV